MMKAVALLLLSALVMATSCNNKTSHFLKTSNLQSSYISIKADSAYTLKTGKGAVIKIEANSFDMVKGGLVDIEIKEAFSMQEILLAGLSTQCDGRPLRSGGMIYFNASSQGKPLDFKKPVSISMPSEIYDPAMQLFQGEFNADSTVNWIAPTALDTTPNAKFIMKGEALFKANCASCHKVSADFTGPALYGISKRVSREWVHHFTQNPAGMVAAREPYALYIYNKWRPTVMTAFPHLTTEDIDAILAYCENDEKLNPPDSAFIERINNDCGYDTVYMLPTRADTSSYIDIVPPTDTIVPAAVAGNTEGVEKDFAIRDGIYEFEIEKNGWYNIDTYMPDTKVEIDAHVALETEADIRAYIFFPSIKAMDNAFLSKRNTLLFNNGDKDNRIPAPLGAEAVLLLVGSDDTDMYYAVSRFTVKPTQKIVLWPKKTTATKLLQLIKQNNLDGIKIDPFKKEMKIMEIPCGIVTDTTTAFLLSPGDVFL